MDGSIKLGVEIDTSGLKNGTSTINTALSKTREKLSSFGKAIAKAFTVDTSKLDAKLAKEQQTIEDTTAKISELQAKLDALQSGNVEVESKELTRTQTELDKTKARIEALQASWEQMLERQAQLQSEAFVSPDTNEPLLVGADLEEFNDLNEKLTATEEELKQSKVKADELARSIHDIANDEKQAQIDALKKEMEKLTAVLADAQQKASDTSDEISDAKKGVPIFDSLGKSLEKFGKRLAKITLNLLVFQTINKIIRALASYLKSLLMSDEKFKQDWEELKAAFYTVAQPLVNILIPALKTAVYVIKEILEYVGKLAAAASGVTYAQLVQQAKDSKKIADNYEDMEKSSAKTANNISKQVAGFDDIQIMSSGASASDTASGAADYSAFGSIGKYDPSEEQTVLDVIMASIGTALAAVGLMLFCKGYFATGAGFMTAGAAFWAIKEIWGEEYDPTSVAAITSNIMATIGVSLAAIGLILIFKGVIPWGLGFLVAGAAMFAISEIVEGTYSTDPIMNTLIKIMGIAGTVLAAIGLILLVAGQIPWGIAALAAGAVMLVSAVAMSSNKIVQLLQGPLGIIMGIVGGALLVLGIILVFTGVGIPLGLALIAAGAVSLVTVIAANSNSILNVIKSVWKSIQNFWNKYIAPVFTGKFWADLGKKALNGLATVIENYINAFIGIWEALINFIVKGINKISVNVPDWVPGIGGKKFGFNIPEVNFKRVSIPKLATGAVIPGGREFMAVLGDQPRGQTNIEAPAELIKQMVKEAIREQGGTGGDTTVVLELDGREFGRAVVEQGNRENRRVGTRLVVV